MKRMAALLTALTVLCISCSEKLEFRNAVYHARRGTEVERSPEGMTSFYPVQGTLGRLFDVEVPFDPEYLLTVDRDGTVLEARTAGPAVIKNGKAEMILPAGTELTFLEDYGSYYCVLGEGLTGRVRTDLVEYPIHENAFFNGSGDIRALVGSLTAFQREGQEILFLKNDSPIWSDSADFDYRFYSRDYRNEMEKGLLEQMDLTTLEDLSELFSSPDGAGVRNYNGQGFFTVIRSGETDLNLDMIADDGMIGEAFAAMSLERPFPSSYRMALTIRLDVRQGESTAPGVIVLIVPDEEEAELADLLWDKKDLYLAYRMASFSDFSALGLGILYFGNSREGLEELGVDL